jgi:hypothetical protein
MTPPLLPVHEQLREDAALGAAWRRCEAALPPEWRTEYVVHQRQIRLIGPGDIGRGDVLYSADLLRSDGDIEAVLIGLHNTPAGALEMLADALERRRDGVESATDG